nr:uncharacterized protein LOC117997190 isoform X1 [Maniola hyperantus]
MKMEKIYSIAIVLVFAAGISAESIIPNNQLEEQILSLLNKWRKGSVQTNLFPLPSLKSTNINQIDSYYDGRGIKITFSIGDMTLTGLDNFSVKYLNVTQSLDDISVSAELFVPVLTLHSENYNLKGRAYVFYPLQGHGKMTVLIRDVDVSLSVHFASVADVNMRIDDFALEFNISKVDATLENSSWPINQVLNKEGVQIIESFHEDVVNAAWDYAVPYANDYLANISPGDFLKIISDISVNSYIINNNTK